MTTIHVMCFWFFLLAIAGTSVMSAPQREGRQFTLPPERPHVAILKQINQMNPDGSYTYGFEAADGSFRVETRDPQGFVKGKYGYVDELGEVKTVDYVAGKPGFNPQGQHLPIPNGPMPSSGNFDDEFGTDEDWESVDADEDGNPDPPRPHSSRNTPIPRPAPPVFQQRPPAEFRPSQQHQLRPAQPIPFRPAGPPFPFQLAGPAGQQRFVPVGSQRN